MFSVHSQVKFLKMLHIPWLIFSPLICLNFFFIVEYREDCKGTPASKGLVLNDVDRDKEIFAEINTALINIFYRIQYYYSAYMYIRQL